jgi:hypothetical protein
MIAIASLLKGLYERWRFVEDDEVPAAKAGPRAETDRLRAAVEREERRLADYRRMKLEAMARDSEASLRALKGRLLALEMGAAK